MNANGVPQTTPSVSCRPGCNGVPLAAYGACLGHLNATDLSKELKRFHAEGTLDAQGVAISASLLSQILNAVPIDGDGTPIPWRPCFNRATFGDKTEFDGVVFGDDVMFEGAKFGDDVSFHDVKFGDRTRFDVASFGHRARFVGIVAGDHTTFEGTTFDDDARFDGAIFGDDTQLIWSTFLGEARFEGTNFGQGAQFGGVNFHGDVWFERIFFGDDASFTDAIFDGQTRFGSFAIGGGGALVGDRAVFDRAAFRGDVWFERITFGNSASFAGTTFDSNVSFREYTRFGDCAAFDRAAFRGRTRFERTTFGDHARFERTAFDDHARFERTTFGTDAAFLNAKFLANASLGDRTTFGDRARFDGSRFGDGTIFADVTFGNETRLTGDAFGDRSRISATFGDHARLDGVTFGDHARLDGVTFGDHARLDGIVFGEDAGFVSAIFGSPSGPESTASTVQLASVTLEHTPDLVVLGTRLIAEHTNFPDGASIRVAAETRVRLRSVKFGSPSTLGLIQPTSKPEIETPPGAERPAKELQSPSGEYKGPDGMRPRLLSITATDVTNLTLVAIDLRACQFSGAHNLDQLNVQGAFSFAGQPDGWKWSRNWPPIWRWTSRQVIAEEQQWRARYERGTRRSGWYPKECRHPDTKDPLAPLPRRQLDAAARTAERSMRQDDARLLAQTYRSLRKGAEDRRDEPGGADFYFGEMEMRRAATVNKFERTLLYAYWLVSGYALRASRALATLLIVVLVAAVIFATIGFKSADPIAYQQVGVTAQGNIKYQTKCVYGSFPGGKCKPRQSAAEQFPEALAFSVESTTSLLRPLVRPLTTVGEWTQVALRLLGPLLFALAVLSLRGRVKR